eukprot:1152265-Pelagomonas_calceolata.AAC.9
MLKSCLRMAKRAKFLVASEAGRRGGEAIRKQKRTRKKSSKGTLKACTLPRRVMSVITCSESALHTGQQLKAASKPESACAPIQS